MTADDGEGPTATPGDLVRIYEVGPRDGLQNEANPIPLATKLRYLELLADAGLREIEATSFVAPTAIPQLADADELMATLPRRSGVRYPVLVPNVRGLADAGLREIEATSFVAPTAIPQLADADELMATLARRSGVRYPVLVPNVRGLARAEAAHVDAIAVFTAATDAFTTRNIRMTVAESLDAFAPVLARAGELGWWRRGYVSTAFGCPYSGAVTPETAVGVAVRLLDLGVEEICFGDTIGVGVPPQVRAIVGRAVDAGIPLQKIAFHFHDTRGTALANVAAAMSEGIRCFDASTGGTGGCPYAPGAAGNLATEDLVYLLDAIGLDHGVALDGVLRAARFIADALGKPLATKVGQAGGWDPATGRPTGRA